MVAIIILSAIAYTAYDHSISEKDKLSIPSMYVRAQLLEKIPHENGLIETPVDIYTRITEIDRTEEDAWHNKGRILNHLEMCSESVIHYRQYVREFPDSQRAMDGHEIAKECDGDVVENE